MKTILNTLSGFYGAVRLDLRAQAADAGPAGRQPGVFSLLSAWRERAHFREELALRARDTPYLIGDIGLTMDDVREEIAKPCWRR
ncbi:hypothetical protein [Mesorhizobium sp. WSM3224]|uniref:hypothetical protein n=1 Tax=Mesorhizobium sp. WSM3224 TaxID=1040986 RepID=UPI00041002A1|nr:hypothetical protein [Mesorhizobium sp. WSM3224]